VLESPLLTVAEVAARLRLSPRAVRARLHAGRLPGMKVGRAWRIREADLAAAPVAHLALRVEAGAALAASLDVEATLAAFGKLAVPALADYCLVDLLGDGPELNRVVAAHAAHVPADRIDVLRHYPPHLDNPRAVIGDVVRTGEPLILPTAPPNLFERVTDDPARRAALRALAPSSLLILPLQARGNILGAMTLARMTPGWRYQPDDVALVKELAAHAALVIDSARLYAAEQRARTLAEAAQQRLAVLAEAGAALVGSLDVEATLATVTRLVVPRLADWAVVWWRDAAVGERPTLRPVAARHRDPARAALLDALHQASLATGRFGTVDDVLRTGKPALATELGEDHWDTITQEGDYRHLLHALGPRSHLMLPLAARGQLMGVLVLVLAESGRRFGPDDLALGEELAARAAVALDNARLHEEAQAALRARDTFLSIASHELRTPVTSIKGFVQALLRQQQHGGIDARQLARALPVIDRSTNRLTVLIEDLLDVSRIRLGRLLLNRRPVDLAELARLVLERYRPQVAAAHELTLGIASAPPAVLADIDRLDQVLSNLLDNALKYSPDGGPIVVTVASDGPGVRLSVRDAGIGMPAGTTEIIFEPFGRADNAADRQIAGLGLGLYICRSIVDQHGGRVWAESPGEGQGTTLHVWLPAAADMVGTAAQRESAAEAPPVRAPDTWPAVH
jgi:excisionase family DNA binding protein